jgi:hypothetical protein
MYIKFLVEVKHHNGIKMGSTFVKFAKYYLECLKDIEKENGYFLLVRCIDLTHM